MTTGVAVVVEDFGAVVEVDLVVVETACGMGERLVLDPEGSSMHALSSRKFSLHTPLLL